MGRRITKAIEQLLCGLRGHGPIVRWRCQACGYRILSAEAIRRLEAIEQLRGKIEQFAQELAQEIRRQQTRHTIPPRRPAPAIDWRKVLSLPAGRPITTAEVSTAFKSQVKRLRPDLPAANESESTRKAQALAQLIAARDAAFKELGK